MNVSSTTSFGLDRHVGLNGGWPTNAPPASDVTLRAEVEPEARGLDVQGHVARIVGHLLAAGDGATAERAA